MPDILNSALEPQPDPLETAIAEFLAVAESGGAPDRDALAARYPDLAEELREFMQAHDRLRLLAEPLRPKQTGGFDPTVAWPDSNLAAGRPSEAPTIPPSRHNLAGAAADSHSSLPTQHGDDHLPDAARYFGGYELLAEVARGGMGVVYKARHLRLNRIVALKMILAGQLASRDDVKRFYAEAEAAAGLDHPGIVPVYEVAEHEGQHYFTMGFVEGQSLAEALRGGPLPPQTAAELLKKLAEAVAYAHSKGVVHRDLKPANVLLAHQASGGRKPPDELPINRNPSLAVNPSHPGNSRSPLAECIPKITDFGLAKRLDTESSLTATGQILGTPSYMPPEQAAGKLGQVREPADIYALGAILYTMLTGRPPFVADSPLDIIVQVLESEPTLPHKVQPGVPQALEWICLRCLEKDPAQRYASAAALADDLDRYLRQEPVEARSANLWQRARRWARREPALAAHLAGVGLALVITQVKFIQDPGDWAYHARVTAILSAWGLSAFVFQFLLNRERWSEAARYLWSAADILFLALLLWCIAPPVGPPIGPLQVGFPLLIAASGLFFRVRLVACTTGLAILADAALWLLRPAIPPTPWHYAGMFWVALAILGFVVGYQVRRVRVLSQYYEHRNLP